MVDFGLISGRKTNNLARQAQVAPSLAKLALNTSASQHKTWKRCKRYWYLQKVCGLKERQRQHFVIGKALHSVAELYISGAVSSWDELFPAGWDKGLAADEAEWIRRVAAKAVQEGVWQAVPGSYIEYPIAFLVGDEFLDARGLPLLARAQTYGDEQGVRRIANLTALHDGSPLPRGWDRLPPFVGFIDHLILWDTPPVVGDHKTAKHRGYATTPAKLAEDLQVLTYAAVPMVLRPEVELVKLRHNVFLKSVEDESMKETYPVSAEAPYERVRQQWREVIANSEEMAQVRQQAPRIVDPANPYRRADNWHKVKSAVEEGRPSACKEYGGCPARDLCFGRCTAEQLIRRTDAPDPLDIVKKPASAGTATAGPHASPFGLNLRPSTTPTTTTQRSSMPFPKAAPVTPKVNDDAYVLDPDNAQIQLRVRVRALSADGQQATIALYPNPDVVPNFETIGRNYITEVPIGSLMLLPLATGKIVGYQDLLNGQGVTDGLEWTPAAPAATTAPAVAATKKPTDKPEPDGKFGLKVGGAVSVTATVPTSATPPAATPPAATTVEPLPTGAPTWATGVRKGDRLRVLAQQRGSAQNVAYWSKLAGKEALVDDAPMPGDSAGSLVVTVYIDGQPYPDVNCWRFEPASAWEAPAAIGPTTVIPAALPDDLRQRAAALKGAIVEIRLTSTGSPFNVQLEDVDANGIVFLSGQMRPTWDQIRSIELHRKPPGAPPTKEEKAAAKAEAKAQKQAEKEATKAAEKASAAAPTAPGPTIGQATVPGTDPKPGVAPAGALDAALNAIQAALNGGKVTRKVLEGVVPLLQQAKEHQATLAAFMQAGGTATPAGSYVATPPPAPRTPPLFKPSEIGKVVDDAKELIAKASDMLAKVIEF